MAITQYRFDQSGIEVVVEPQTFRESSLHVKEGCLKFWGSTTTPIPLWVSLYCVIAIYGYVWLYMPITRYRVDQSGIEVVVEPQTFSKPSLHVKEDCLKVWSSTTTSITL